MRADKVLPVILLVLITAAVFWFYFAQTDPVAGERGAFDSDSLPGTSSSMSSGIRRSGSGRRGASSPGAEPAGTAADSRRKGLYVRVVERGSRQPVPGAVIAFVDHDGPGNGYLFKAPSPSDRFDELAAGFGRLLRVDDRGEAVLPHFTGKAEIRAICPFGRSQPMMVFTDMIHERVEIEVERLAHVFVKVVDRHDEPLVGAPVALSSSSENPFVERENSVTWTGADGRARIFLPPWRSFGYRFFVTAKSLATTPARREIRDQDLGGVIKLVRPHEGVIRVAVQKHDGTPYDVDTMVSISGATRAGRDTGTLSRVAVGGYAVFRSVEPGLTFQARVSAMEPGHLSAWKEFAGPQIEGETVDVPIAFEEPGCEITFQLLDARGRPAINSPLCGEISSFSGDEQVDGEQLDAWRTGPKGRARIRFEEQLGKGGRRHRLLIWKNGSDESGDQYAHIDLPAPLGPSTDLGIVQLKRAPALVQGWVKEASGRPLAHATVAVKALDGEDGLGAFAQSTTRTDEEGRFFLSSVQGDVSKVRLSVSKEGYRPQVLAVDVPSLDMTVTLKRGGVLRLPVILPAGLEVARLTARITGEPVVGVQVLAQGEVSKRNRMEVDHHEGFFSFRGLGEGEVTLEILNPGDRGGAPLEDLGAVMVSGETVLPVLDLRAYLEKLDFRVVDGEGQPLEGIDVEVTEDGSLSGRGESKSDGRVLIAAKAGADTVQLSRTGLRTLKIPISAATGDIVMRNGYRITLDLGQSVKMPAPPVFVVGTVSHPHKRSTWLRVYFGPDGRATVLLPQPGDYRMSFEFARQSPSGSSVNSAWPKPTADVSFEVEERAGDLIVPVPVEGASLTEKARQVR